MPRDGYPARRDEINAKVGDGDYTQAPEEVTYHDPGDIEIERRIHEVTTDDKFVKGDYEHFDPTPSRLEYDRTTRTIQKRTRPQRPLPSGVPTPDSHAWKSNPPIPKFDSEGKKIKKKVSFGDARQVTFLVEPDLAESERQSRQLIMVATEPASTVDDDSGDQGQAALGQWRDGTRPIGGGQSSSPVSSAGVRRPPASFRSA